MIVSKKKLIIIILLAGTVAIGLSSALIFILTLAVPFRPLGHFDYELVNGYIISGYSPSVVVIITPPEFSDNPSNCALDHAVIAKVDGVAVVDYWIVGHASPSSARSLADDECPGFFIINTRTGDVTHGLSQSGWESAIHAIGINPVPKLKAP
ncbi:MAG: hypothetical protein H6813_06675 [Phycisphaeraceae bacterium]|nr:hypothetical protein [Phycisphaeraceae bacterium]MCB9848155.1 hypothetical protein [Phycisphaeraceae bacterium]